MIRIFAYEDGKVGFYCESCELTFTEDIEKRINNNCALEIELVCSECGESGILYFIKCTEEYMAKELLSKIASMKESRKKLGGV